MRSLIEDAFKFDYNSLIEEWDFYIRMTPRDQTSLVQELFASRIKQHNLFFEGCGDHFVNFIVTGMHARVYNNYKDIVKHGKLFTEMYFIRQGTVVMRKGEED